MQNQYFRILRQCCGVCLLTLSMSQAQVFNSGSSGVNGPFPPSDTNIPEGTTAMELRLSDGVLTFAPGGESVVLPNVPEGGFDDGILHFTTFDIPPGIVLTFFPNRRNTPVTILASEAVTIRGALHLNGEHAASSAAGNGGPGGFRGGNGKLNPDSEASGGGLGPGGGSGAALHPDPGLNSAFTGGGGGGFVTAGQTGGTARSGIPGMGGSPYGAPHLLPLIGGSGGGGGSHDDLGRQGPGGGGGGGSLLLASSQNITFLTPDAAIRANGGNGGQSFGPTCGGGGSGGAIRLIANVIGGNGGHINAVGGGGGCGGNQFGGVGSAGRIRLEAFRLDLVNTDVNPLPSRSLPGVIMLPNPPLVRIARVGDQEVPNPPLGNAGGIDVFLPAAGMTTIEVATVGVPLGTTVLLTAKPDGERPPISARTGAITGTTTNGMATVELDLPPGPIFLEAQATFQLP